MTNIFKQFLDSLRHGNGMADWGRYYGVYRGKVVSTVDPTNMGKIMVNVPEVTQDVNGQIPNPAFPLHPVMADFPPEVGDGVYVLFEDGRAEFPVWLGHWWGKDKGPHARPTDLSPAAGAAPTKRFFVTASGHRLVFEDKAGGEEILIQHEKGSFVRFATDGSVTVDVSSTAAVNITMQGQPAVPVPVQELATKTAVSTGSGHTHMGSSGPTSGPLGPGGVGDPAALPVLGMVTQTVRGN